MPKPTLAEPFRGIEDGLIDALLAGLREWRPDLSYPESRSDMQACVRNAMRMFKIERAPKVIGLRYTCGRCLGTGFHIFNGAEHVQHTCPECSGRGYRTEKLKLDDESAQKAEPSQAPTEEPMSNETKTREEREREAWELWARTGCLAEYADTLTSVFVGCNHEYDAAPEVFDATELRRLRDALNHRLRELGEES